MPPRISKEKKPSTTSTAFSGTDTSEGQRQTGNGQPPLDSVPTPPEALEDREFGRQGYQLDQLLARLHSTYRDREILMASALPSKNDLLTTVLINQMVIRGEIAETVFGTEQHPNKDPYASITYLDHEVSLVEERSALLEERGIAKFSALEKATDKLHQLHLDHNLTSIDWDRHTWAPTATDLTMAQLTHLRQQEGVEAATMEAAQLHYYCKGLKELVADLHAVYEAKSGLQEMETLANKIETELNAWDIRKPGTAVQEEQLKTNLADLGLFIRVSEAAEHDSGRATILKKYVQSRYRFESRRINHHGIKVGSSYTPDGGILIDEGKDTETVLYDDGALTVSRDGRVKIVSTDGKEWQAPKVESIDESINLDPEQAFITWEHTRLPRGAELAHKALDEHIRTLRSEDILTTKRLRDTAVDINEVQEEIKVAKSQYRNTANKEDIRRAHKRKLEGLQVHLTALQQNERSNTTRQKAVRSKLSRHLYWLGFFEIDTDPTPDEERIANSLGNIGLQKDHVPSRQDEMPLRPILRRDGGLLWRNQMLHGIRADWRIWPNGTARYYDHKLKRFVRVAASGTKKK